jgi:hypothetical protein
MHYLLLIYFNNKPLHVSSRLAAHHQDDRLCTNSNWYTHVLCWLVAASSQSTQRVRQQLTDKIVKTSTNSSGIYKLKCNACNNSYVGQSGRSIATKYKEHTLYIRTNNPIWGYALHKLNNRHEYGTAKETLELLKPCNKGTKMNCWEALYMQAHYQRNVLIEEQKVIDINPLYELADTPHNQLCISWLSLLPKYIHQQG